MTTPTGPDDDRLRASTAGQETCPDCGAQGGERCQNPAGRELLRAHSSRRRPAPRPAPQPPPAIDSPLIAVHDAAGDQTQQPPAQEQAAWCPTLAPPSEADSAGEAVVPTPEDWDAAEGCVERACQGNRWTEVIARVLADQRAALAASSGVRGGDDQARERLADVLALHVPWYEIDGVRHDNLVAVGCGSFKRCDGNDQFWCSEADEHPHEVPACYECRCVIDGDLEGHLLWPCPTVRAAGGGR